MAYVDYNYYVNTYKGSIIQESKFDTLAERGAEYISAFTYGLSDGDDLTETELQLIKKCNCAVAEVLCECGITGVNNGIKSSETVGSWHVSYATPSVSNGTGADYIKDMLLSKVRVYLGRTRLLYMGVL